MATDSKLTAEKAAAGVTTITGALAKAITTMGTALAMGIVLFIRTLEMNAKVVGTSLKNFILTVIDVLFTARIEINRKLIRELSDLFAMLEEELPSLFEHFNNTLLILLEQVADNAIVYGYFGSVIAGYFVSGVMYGLADSAKPLIDSAIALGYSLCDALYETVKSYKPNATAGFKKFGLNVAKAVYDVVGTSVEIINYDLGQQIKGLGDEADAEIAVIDEEVRRANEERIKNRAYNNHQAFQEASQDAAKKADYTGIKDTYAAKQMQAMDQTKVSEESGQNNALTYLDAIKQYVDANGGDYGEAIKNGAYNLFGTSLSDGGTAGAEEAKRVMTYKLDEIPSSLADTLKKQGYVLNEAGDALVKEVTTSISDGTSGSEAEKSKEQFESYLGTDGSENGLLGVLKSFTDLMSGQADESAGAFGDGLVNKLSSSDLLDRLGEAATLDATTIKDNFNDVLKIESPSKVAMQSANYWVDGLLIPLNTRTTELEKAAITNANAIGDSFNSQIQNGSNNLEFTPTIRPVLDSSNMGQYGGLMNILDNPTTVKLAADSQLSIDNANQFRLGQQIDALRADINKMANTDFSKIMDGVTIDVSADTTVDGTVLRKTASSYTIGQINKKQQGYIMATGGRF